MSNLLSGPNAITPWISAAVLERLHKTTTATDLQVTGPKLAQLIDLTRVVGGDINNTDDNNNNNKSSIQTKNDQNKADKGVAEPGTVTETESKFQSTVPFISDGQVRIGVLLTASQRAALLKQGGDGLTGSLVRIPEGWRVVVGPRGQSLRLVLSDETSLQILGSRGLRTVGNPREIHYDIQVRRVLASLQWDVIHQRLSQAQLLEQSQQQQQQQHAPHIAEDTSFTSKSTTAVSTSLHDTCTTPASVDSQKNIPLGDTATFLGYCNEKTVSLPATARTTHDVQALFGKVLLAAAEQQKQKDEQSKEYGKELSNNGPKDHEQTKMQQHKHQPQGNRQTLLEEDPPNCGEWQDISDSRFPQSQLDYTSGNESPKYHPFRISAMLGPLEDSDQEEEEKERSPSVPQAGESQSTQNDADNSQLFETQEPAALGSATFSMQSNLLDLPVQRSECAGKLGTSPEAQVFGQAVTAISSEQKYRREEHDKQGLSQQNTESNAGKALSSEDLRGHEQPISKTRHLNNCTWTTTSRNLSRTVLLHRLLWECPSSRVCRQTAVDRLEVLRIGRFTKPQTAVGQPEPWKHQCKI